ncbi:MAG: sulfotransferase [Candidatus Promineofilum sp.]|nr:sulfotransferase [Promineifilum sp.]
MNPVKQPTDPRHASRPIFIVGYMHSGTTLLRKVIGRHPDVFSIRAETMFFDQLAHTLPHRFPRLQDDAILEEYVRFLIKKTAFDWPPLTAAEADLEAKQFQPDEEQIRRIIIEAKANRDYQTIFSLVFESIAAAAGKSHWIEKTPSHIFYVDEIVKALPDVRIIELVRDPRDVLASKKVRKHSDWSERYGHAVGARMQTTKGYDPLRDSLGWRAAVRAGATAAARYPDALFRLRYEDLASDPERVVRRLCEFLSLTFDPVMLDVGWSNTTVQSGIDRATGIDRSAVGKWQSKLSPDVVSLCQMLNGREMADLGYALRDNSFGSRAKTPYWVARSGADLLAHYYELWRARGLDYVRGMARNSWRRAGHLAKR